MLNLFYCCWNYVTWFKKKKLNKNQNEESRVDPHSFLILFFSTKLPQIRFDKWKKKKQFIGISFLQIEITLLFLINWWKHFDERDRDVEKIWEINFFQSARSGL